MIFREKQDCLVKISKAAAFFCYFFSAAGKKVKKEKKAIFFLFFLLDQKERKSQDDSKAIASHRFPVRTTPIPSSLKPIAAESSWKTILIYRSFFVSLRFNN